MPTLLQKYVRGTASLFYPELCVTCGNKLHQPGQVLCTRCRNTLPETGFSITGHHAVRDIFTGRLPVEGAMALLFFEKSSKYRRLLHALKYKRHLQSGKFLGQLMGARLSESGFRCDAIVPVPLHPVKHRTRGYNQSAVLARGIADMLHCPVCENVLRRTVHNPTQTQKSRYDRWVNVDGIFESVPGNRLQNHHLLLVDDVVTTGATLEAAGQELLKIQGVRLSVATAAYAFH